MGAIKPRKTVEKIISYPLGDFPDDVKREYNLEIVRKMSDNENVYGCSSNVQIEILRSKEQLFRYPDGRSEILKRKLATFYNLREAQMFIGNGSEEIIRLLTRAYINLGDEAVIADPTFPRYETNVSIEGGKVIKIPLIEGIHNLERMLSSITMKTKMVFICNPNNPTGTIVGKRELLHFIEKAPNNVLIILDEAYYEYVTSEDYLHSVSLLDKHSNLIILRTFSKIYGLAGLRIGYGMMAASIVNDLQKVKEVFNVNTLAQSAASTAIDDQDFVKECARKNACEKEFVCQSLQQLGLRFYPSETNFINVFSDFQIFYRLREKGILVRQMKLDGYVDAIRITIGTREDNESFLAVLKSLLNERAV